MAPLKIIAMPTEEARAFQAGALDANGQEPELDIAHGPGNPCRHCLKPIEEGAEKLIFSYRPFSSQQPYAETGPIFLHKRTCDQHAPHSGLPKMFERWDAVIVRGYNEEDRIEYGAAEVTPVAELESACHRLLQNPAVAYLHIRTARYNCFQCRVERG